MDTTTFNAVFFSFLITSVIGCLLKFSAVIYKSKCKEFQCCCLKVIRDVETEEKLDEVEANRITKSDTKDNL